MLDILLSGLFLFLITFLFKKPIRNWLDKEPSDKHLKKFKTTESGTTFAVVEIMDIKFRTYPLVAEIGNCNLTTLKRKLKEMENYKKTLILFFGLLILMFIIMFFIPFILN